MRTREKKGVGFFFSSLMILHSDVFFFVVVVGLFSVGFFVCLFLLFVFFLISHLNFSGG